MKQGTTTSYTMLTRFFPVHMQKTLGSMVAISLKQITEVLPNSSYIHVITHPILKNTEWHATEIFLSTWPITKSTLMFK